jgi:hypothetical protein
MKRLLRWAFALWFVLNDAASSSSLMEFENNNAFAPVCKGNNTNDDVIQDLIQWIRGNGGRVDERQAFRGRNNNNNDNTAYATAFIPAGTVLLSVPWNLIIEGKRGDFCDLVKRIHQELAKNKHDKSDYGPYMHYLESKMSMMMMDQQDVNDESWSTRCSTSKSLVSDELKKAVLLVTRYSRSEYGWYEMIPFRDFYQARPQEANARLMEDENDEITTLIASRDIEAEECISSSYVPDAWWTWRRKEMKKYLDCKSVNQATRPVHSHETWVHLRRLYRQTVGPEQSTISSNDTLDGFDGVPIQAAYSPGKGRGIFATGNIKKDTRVWTLMHQSARFPDGASYRKFLASVPPDMACDLLKFGYIEDMGEEGQPDLALRVDLDEASYTNTAGWDDDVEANIGCPPELEGSDDCEFNEYALRDIFEGEEIYSNYIDFALPEAWEHFGL